MTAALLLAFAGFAFVTSITPGPNNAMLLASGVNHGFRRTLPHIAGINLGCVLMLLLVGLGLGKLFTAVPVLYSLLRYAGAAYLLWLAWQIARAGPVAAGGVPRRPMRFCEAAAFQWVNPKAWIIVVGAVTTYAPRENFARNVVVIAVLLALVNAPIIALWAAGGVALRRLLHQTGRVRAFNLCMALLLVLSLYPILEN
jgi:threonine/homoserine/homoserine lactone efflux protein